MRQLFRSAALRRLTTDIVAFSVGTVIVLLVAKLIEVGFAASGPVGGQWVRREASWSAAAHWFSVDIWVGIAWGVAVSVACAIGRGAGGTRLGVTVGAVLQATLGIYLTISLYVYDLFGVPPTWPLLQSLEGGAARDSVLAFVEPHTVALLLAFVGALTALPLIVARASRRSKMVRTGLVAGLAHLALVTQLAGAGAGPSSLGLDRNALMEFVTSLWPLSSESDAEAVVAEGSFGRALRPVAERHVVDIPISAYLRLRRWATARRPNVVLIVMESTADRHLSLTGGDVPNTPWLDSLAQTGLLWARHYSHTPRSMNSLYSILCGQHPRPMSQPITLYRPRIACGSASEILSRLGYDSALFHSGTFHYTRKLRFFDDRGYRVLLDADTLPGSGTRYDRWSWGIEEQASVDALLDWVGTAKSPFFATYIPVYPHHPYHVPHAEYERFSGKGKESDYENAVYYVDQMIGRIVTGFEERGVLDETLFVIVGDHGEAFGEHPGSKVHGGKLYEEQVRSFVLWSAPGALKGRFEEERATGHVDLLPTLIDLLGESPRPEHPSPSLADRRPRPMIPLYSPSGFSYFGLVDGRWKFIYDNKTKHAELYDLRTDPGERASVAAQHPGLVQMYARRIHQFRSAQKKWEQSLRDLAAHPSNEQPLDARAKWTFDPATCVYPADHFAVEDGQLRMVHKSRRANVHCVAELPPIRGRVTSVSISGSAAVKRANMVVTLAWEGNDGIRKMLASGGFAGTPKHPAQRADAELVTDTTFGRGGRLIADITYKYRGGARDLSYETFRIDSVVVKFDHDGRVAEDVVRFLRTTWGR